MCENQDIRYVHQMQHPDYPNILECGNHYLKTDGFHIVVFPKDSGWSGKITRLSTGVSTQARRLYDTQDKAKLGAFDGMIWLKSH